LEITEGEAWVERDAGLPAVKIPRFLARILEEIAFCGRDSEYVDQMSGVSARLSIAAREILISQVERRMLANPKSTPHPRIVDLARVVPAITGKVELVYEGEREGASKVARHLIATGCRKVFDSFFPDVIQEGSEPRLKSDRYKPVLDWFAKGHDIEIADDMDDQAYCAALEKVPGLEALAREFLPQKSRFSRAVVMEFILEGLHAHSLLAKEDTASSSSYSDMLGVMLEGFR
jgi:magnesium chelatase subunit I